MSDGAPPASPDPNRPRAATALESGLAAGQAGRDLLEPLLDALPDAVALVQPDGLVVWANRAFADLFAVLLAEKAPRPSIVAVAGPYAQQAEGRQLLELVERGHGEAEQVVFARGGHALPTLVRVRTVGGGSSLRVVAISNQADLQRARAELVLKAEAVVKEREVLRATAEALEEAVLVADDTERLVMANSSARRLFGLGVGDAHGRSVSDLPLPAALRGAWLAFLASGRGSAVQTGRVAVGHDPRTLLMRFARARTARGLPLASVAVVRDLTRVTAPDRQRFDFVTDVSRELRTPIATVRGFAQALASGAEIDDRLRNEFALVIDREAARLGSLIDNLLEVAQLDSGALVLERRPEDLRQLLARSVACVQELAPAPGVPVRATAGGGLPVEVWVDAARIERVLVQLLANALLHGASPHGVEAAVEAHDDGAAVTVRDWGRGVPPEDLEKIFDPFYRVLPAGQSGSDGGAGLGLALCRQVVERHGGTLHAELPEDGGLRMVVELPLS